MKYYKYWTHNINIYNKINLTWNTIVYTESQKIIKSLRQGPKVKGKKWELPADWLEIDLSSESFSQSEAL